MSESEFEGEDVMDSYEEYAEWLMKNYAEKIYNSDSLVRLLEDGDKFDEFLRERK